MNRVPAEHGDVEKALSIRGQALRNGVPWRGVVRWKDVESQGYEGEVRCSPDGAFAFDAVPTELIEISAWDQRATRVEHLLMRDLRSYQDDSSVDVELRWVSQDLVISGVALDASGDPVERVAITAMSAREPVSLLQAVSGADGRFTIREVHGELYQLSARHGAVRMTKSEVFGGTEDVEFRFPKQVRVVVRVVDAKRCPVAPKTMPRLAMGWRYAASGGFRPLRGRPGKTDYRVVLPVGQVDLALYGMADGWMPAYLSNERIHEEGQVLEVVMRSGSQLEIEVENWRAQWVRDGFEELFFLLREDQLGGLRSPLPTDPIEQIHRINGMRVWLAEPGLVNQLVNICRARVAVVKGLRPGAYKLIRWPGGHMVKGGSVYLGQEVAVQRIQVQVEP